MTVALMLSVGAWHAHGSLIQSPDLPAAGMATLEAMPPEIREAFSQSAVASQSQAILAERSAQLRDLVVRNPADPYPLHALGTVTYHLGGEAEAMALWTNAADRDPNLAPAEVMAAVHAVFALLHQEEVSRAQQQLRAAEKQYENQPHFQLMRAEQAMRSRNFSEAERAFEKAHALAPQLFVTKLNLGRFYEVMQRDPAEIAALYERAAELAPTRAEVWYYLGTAQFRLQQTDAALQSFRRLHALVPDSPLPERRLADLHLAAGDFAAAEPWLRAASDKPLPAADEAAVRAALGDVLLRLGKTAQARSEIEAALGFQEQPPLLFALATLDEADGETEAAETRYRRVLALLPGHPLAANNLAMLMLKSDRGWEEAMQLVEQARAAIPGNAIIESTYGCALSRLDRHQEAIDVLDPAARVLENDGWTHLCLGLSLSALGREGEANVRLRHAIAVAPELADRAEVKHLRGEMR